MGSLTLTELAKGRLQFRAPRKYGGYFRRDQEHRDFVSIGTAAGEHLSVVQSSPASDPMLLLMWHLLHASHNSTAMCHRFCPLTPALYGAG